MNRFLLLPCLVLAFFVGCSSNSPQTVTSPSGAKLDSVVLMLNWYPEAEHGGFYAAKVHGIFESHGLDVEIRPGGPSAPVAQELMTGRVQFAIGNADDVLLFREQEAPILALLAPIQNTPRCIMVRADSPAQSLDQLAGMTLQANVGRPFLTFMENRGLLKEVRVVPYSGSVANFVSDTNTAIQAYAFSEPLLAQQQGVSTRQLMLSDVGFNPYASCLITTENYASEREDVVQRMVSACREGWAQYFEDASRSNAAILADNPHGMTQEALEFGVKELRPLCLPEGLAVDDVGSMDLQRWQALVDQFAQLGLLDAQKVPASAVFTTKYLEQSKAQVAE